MERVVTCRWALRSSDTKSLFNKHLSSDLFVEGYKSGY